uniref:Secreted protein n=1 Tax=Aquila chrysaetos chrysaetos TaxID=223781 RepID=A0A663EY06_AQUCH
MGFPCKTQTLAVLLAFPALFCCSSRTLGSGPCRYSAGLRFRQRSHLVFFHLQVSHREVQPNAPFRSIGTAAKFTGVAPAGWLFRARVSEQGLAAQLLAVNIYARNMLLQSSKQQSFSCTNLCFALPAAIRLFVCLVSFIFFLFSLRDFWFCTSTVRKHT